MKILFANNLQGYYGGVEQVVEDYARGLTRRGYQCFLAYGNNGRNPERYAKSFVATYACAEFGCSDNGISFAEIVRSVGPDVVFVHKVNELPPGLEKSTVYRKLLMVHDHDLWCPKATGYYTHNRRTCQVAAGLPCYFDLAFLQRRDSGWFPFRLRNIRAKKRQMRRSHHFDIILVLSEYLKRQLVINGFPEQRIRIHNPVLDQRKPEQRPFPEAPRVLYVGSLVNGKGVDLLLRALAMLSCPVILDIVGTGNSEADLRALTSRLDLDDQVNFVGWVSHGDLSPYYQQARVIAVPSCWPEPFGLTGQEAMRCARPVVAFNVGGIADWCEDGVTGFVVPEQDVGAFASALQRLLTNFHLAQEMGHNGLNRVETQFSFEANLDMLERHLLFPESHLRALGNTESKEL